MPVTPYQLYQHLQKKGYVIPMEGQISVDDLPLAPSNDGKAQVYNGTGERLRNVMELDRRNVYKAYFGATMPDDYVESTWLAGDEPGHGMKLPLWAERIIHAEVLVMQEKIDSTIEYLLYQLEKEEIK